MEDNFQKTKKIILRNIMEDNFVAANFKIYIFTTIGTFGAAIDGNYNIFSAAF